MTACVRSPLGFANDWEQWPHWNGFLGYSMQTCTCSIALWGKDFLHWPHFHRLTSDNSVMLRVLLSGLRGSLSDPLSVFWLEGGEFSLVTGERGVGKPCCFRSCVLEWLSGKVLTGWCSFGVVGLRLDAEGDGREECGEVGVWGVQSFPWNATAVPLPGAAPIPIEINRIWCE